MNSLEQNNRNNSSLERNSRLTVISKPEGNYHIMYGYHTVTQNPNVLPSHIDGFALESGAYNWGVENAQQTVNDMLRHPQYLHIVTTAASKKTPIYMCDPYIPDLLKLLVADKAVMGIETASGLHILSSSINEVKRNKDSLTRRDFLRIGFQSLVGAWMSTHTVDMATQLISSVNQDIIGPKEEIVKANAKLHPELGKIILSLRNLIIAHKLQHLMEHLGGKPDIAISLGLGHAGIEDKIQNTPRERIEELEYYKPIVNELINNPTFYTITGFQASRSNVTKVGSLEVPDLKRLLVT